MKKIMMPTLVLIFIACLCVQAGASDLDMACNYKRYGLDPANFFIYLTGDTSYKQWRIWPDEKKVRPGKAPHGSFLTTYVNPAASRSISNKTDMVLGSIIVAENYGDEKKLRDITVMIKIKDYNPDAGDWHWFQFAPDGTVIATGKVDTCIQCHSQKKGNDFIMTAPVK